MTASAALRGVVVGAGPAGIYATQALLRRYPSMHVDLLDRLPVPFGLVRYGVSPDHPATKNAISQFSSFISSNRDRVSFFGNIAAGPGTALPDEMLAKLYDVSIFATGAKSPRRLPDVELPPEGVHSAHDFARWVNGHPELDTVTRDDIERRVAAGGHVAIIGVGNVAIDVARMLLRSPEDMRDTDVSPRALDVFQEAKVSSVTLIGRKNPARAAWTTAALREVLTKIPGVVSACNHRLVQQDMGAKDVSRKTKRALKLLAERTVDDTDRAQVGTNATDKLLRLQFLRSPCSFTLLSNGDVEMQLASRDAGERDESYVKETYRSIFLSLGYCPSNGSGYRVGWANGKATGIIGDNKWDAESVVSAMPDLDEVLSPKPGLSQWLIGSSKEVVTWEGWERINKEEKNRGVLAGRENGKVKLETLPEMLQVALGPSLP